MTPSRTFRRLGARQLGPVGLLAATVLALLLAFAGPAAAAGLAIPIDFGHQQVGTTSPEQTGTVPLSATVDQVRPDLLAAAQSSTFQPIVVSGIQVLSADQVKTVVIATINALDGTDVIAYRIDSLALDSTTDFALGPSTTCIGADGTSTPTCTVGAVFHPSTTGTLSTNASAQITVTQYPASLQSALAAGLNAIGLPGSLLSAVLSALLPIIRSFLDGTFSSSLNPVAVLTGIGDGTPPPPDVPEAPWAALLPLVGLATLGGGLLWQRRRAASR